MQHIDLTIDLLGAQLLSPVLNASGTLGLGGCRVVGMDFLRFGALVTKTVTLKPRAGNTGLRLWEVPNGLVNRIGLENSGIEVFLAKELPQWLSFGPPVIVNISGFTIQEFVELVKRLNGSRIIAIEVNLSCPNVEHGMALSQDPKLTFEIVSELVKVSELPLIIKLTPNVDEIGAIAQAAQKAGASAISAINTIKHTVRGDSGEVIITGGLSGPVIMPTALKKVGQICQAVKIPVIGMGGISTGADAVKFLQAGATAVAVGTASFRDPFAIQRIYGEIKGWMSKGGYSSLADIPRN